MSQLSVNLDLVAALREVRGLTEPDPTQAAVLTELAFADGVAVQLRRDRQGIRERDLYLLKGVTKTKLILEMPPAEDIVEKVLEVKPWMVTFVADHADINSPVSTINISSAPVDYGELSNRFSSAGISVGFFVEPNAEEIKGAAKAGAVAVLINCAGYTHSRTLDEAQSELDRIDRAVQAAAKAGLTVHCGRGINYKNVRPLVELGAVDEFVIGHAIIARAMLVGLERAVREMLQLMGN